MKYNIPLNVIITTGGTGGHIYPAICIAEEIKLFFPKSNVLLILINSFNKEIYKKYKIKCININIKLKITDIFSLNKIGNNIYKLIKLYNIIIKFNPDIVIGTGSKFSIPVILFSKIIKIPILLHEQNIIAGITNIILSSISNRICLGFKKGEKNFINNIKTVFTGNPIRREITDIIYTKEQACKILSLSSKKITILSIGGSQGSSTLNKIWDEYIKYLLNYNIQLIWQTGNYEFKYYKNKYIKYSNILLFNFISKINIAYSAADIIISRSGAISITEISYFKKANILIPLYSSKNNHQLINAKLLEKNNATILIEENKIHDKFLNNLLLLINNKKLRKKLSSNVKKFYFYNTRKKLLINILKTI